MDCAVCGSHQKSLSVILSPRCYKKARSDALTNGRRLRPLTVVAEWNRAGRGIEVRRPSACPRPAVRLFTHLHLVERHGPPTRLLASGR